MGNTGITEWRNDAECGAERSSLLRVSGGEGSTTGATSVEAG